MSIETTCPNCHAEFDTRHEDCPSCTIEVQLRDVSPPYGTFPAKGLTPFHMHGELFAVTELPTPLNAFQKWRVTHVETGCKVTEGHPTPKEAKEHGIALLSSKSPDQLQTAIASVKAKFKPTQ